MGEAPARLLWVNGPPFVGKRTLAAAMRDRWGLVAFRAEEVGFELQAGLPGPLDPGGLQDLGAWVWALWRLGARLARLYPPVVVMPATLYRPDVAGELMACLRRDGVDVVHVVLDADDAELRGRVHASGACLEAKRWALEHARPAREGLAQLGDAVRLDTTGWARGDLGGVTSVLVERGWLTPSGEAWTGAGR